MEAAAGALVRVLDQDLGSAHPHIMKLTWSYTLQAQLTSLDCCKEKAGGGITMYANLLGARVE